MNVTEALKSSSVIAVVGTGAMGAGIAQVAAAAGHVVKLLDNRPEAAAKAVAGIRAQFARLAEKGKLTFDAAHAAGERLVPVDQLHDGTGTPTNPDKFVHDMADAINRIMADPEKAKRMGQAGYERARDHFSWESIADKTVKVYEDVLAERK